MKDQILKLAGVKSEAAFYKKFPSEAAFMKVHGKAFKKAAMGASMVKKQLTQLTDFSNPPKAQLGINTAPLPGAASTAAGTATKKIDPYLQAGMDVVEGVSMIKGQNEAVKESKQNSLLTGVQAQAIASKPRDVTKNYYTRPEDTIIQPEQLFPSYGAGTNILSAQDGAMVGGNPGEIQNTYDPNNLYDDLGYEPLNDSDQIKSFYSGGKLTKAQDGFETFMSDQGGSEAMGSLSNMLIN